MMMGTDRLGHQGEGVETVRLHYPRSGESIETLLLLGPPGSLELALLCPSVTKTNEGL